MVVPATHHWINSSGRSPCPIDGRRIKIRCCGGLGGHGFWNGDRPCPPSELKLDLHLEVINLPQRAAVRCSEGLGVHPLSLQPLAIGPRQHLEGLGRGKACAEVCFLPRIGWQEPHQLSDFLVLPTNWRLCHVALNKAPLGAEKDSSHDDYSPNDALAWYDSGCKRSSLLTDLEDSVDAANDWEVEW